MYKNQFVMCIMVDDEVLREVRKDGADVVYLPFGTDYQIRLKNLDHRRAVVSMSIDGDDVLDGSRLVVDGNSTTDLKGFLDSKTNKARNAFRFIEKTERVSKHRGDRADDGLVRVELQFEEDLPQVEQIIKYVPHYPYPWQPWDPWFPCQPSIWWGGAQSSNIQPRGTFRCSGDTEFQLINCSHQIEPTADLADGEVGEVVENIGETTNTVRTGKDGITVTGLVVNQGFTTTHIRRLAPEKVVLVLKLQGETSKSKPVVKPLRVKSKIECPTCGIKNNSAAKFCVECGTCLL